MAGVKEFEEMLKRREYNSQQHNRIMKLLKAEQLINEAGTDGKDELIAHIRAMREEIARKIEVVR